MEIVLGSSSPSNKPSSRRSAKFVPLPLPMLSKLTPSPFISESLSSLASPESVLTSRQLTTLLPFSSKASAASVMEGLANMHPPIAYASRMQNLFFDDAPAIFPDLRAGTKSKKRRRFASPEVTIEHSSKSPDDPGLFESNDAFGAHSYEEQIDESLKDETHASLVSRLLKKDRKETQKQRNRVSAQQHRERQKKLMWDLKRELDAVNRSNLELEWKVLQIQTEKAHLMIEKAQLDDYVRELKAEVTRLMSQLSPSSSESDLTAIDGRLSLQSVLGGSYAVVGDVCSVGQHAATAPPVVDLHSVNRGLLPPPASSFSSTPEYFYPALSTTARSDSPSSNDGSTTTGDSGNESGRSRSSSPHQNDFCLNEQQQQCDDDTMALDPLDLQSIPSSHSVRPTDLDRYCSVSTLPTVHTPYDAHSCRASLCYHNSNNNHNDPRADPLSMTHHHQSLACCSASLFSTAASPYYDSSSHAELDRPLEQLEDAPLNHCYRNPQLPSLSPTMLVRYSDHDDSDQQFRQQPTWEFPTHSTLNPSMHADSSTPLSRHYCLGSHLEHYEPFGVQDPAGVDPAIDVVAPMPKGPSPFRRRGGVSLLSGSGVLNSIFILSAICVSLFYSDFLWQPNSSTSLSSMNLSPAAVEASPLPMGSDVILYGPKRSLVPIDYFEMYGGPTVNFIFGTQSQVHVTNQIVPSPHRHPSQQYGSDISRIEEALPNDHDLSPPSLSASLQQTAVPPSSPFPFKFLCPNPKLVVGTPKDLDEYLLSSTDAHSLDSPFPKIVLSLPSQSFRLAVQLSEGGQPSVKSMRPPVNGEDFPNLDPTSVSAEIQNRDADYRVWENRRKIFAMEALEEFRDSLQRRTVSVKREERNSNRQYKGGRRRLWNGQPETYGQLDTDEQVGSDGQLETDGELGEDGHCVKMGTKNDLENDGYERAALDEIPVHIVCETVKWDIVDLNWRRRQEDYD